MRTIYISTLTFLFLLMLSNHGCVSNVGRVVLDREVTLSFETFTLPDNYNFYYSGPDAKPHIILGIHKNYSLRQDFWKKTTLTPQQLKDWLLLMDIEDYDYQPLPFGAKVLDPQGNQIGIWYSRQNNPTILRKQNNEIIIYPPTPRFSLH